MRNDFRAFIHKVFTTLCPGQDYERSWHIEAIAYQLERVRRGEITRLVGEHFDLRPGSFREELKLHRPIYQKTAAYGHFGRDDHDFTWERTDRAKALREAAGL